jgi:gamma-glutamyltranspeptidase/glutathione hydrolase
VRRLLLAAACVALSVGCRSADPFADEQPYVTPQHGVVVAEHPLAVAAGVAILDEGGNAADAAVATALALAVVYPQAGNLGGGGFALWVPYEGDAASLDFRETAPAAYHPALYEDADGNVVAERSLSTPLAVGVPGSPAGLFELFRRHGSGKFRFEDLVRPAERLAREGFTVDAWLAQDLRGGGARERLEQDRAARALFYPGGEPLQEGDRLKQPLLAETLKRFGRGGPAAFYYGDTAEALVHTLVTSDLRHGGLARDGLLSLDDLAGYRVRDRAPLVAWFRGSQVISMGPPSSGGVVLLQVLAVLDGFPLDAERRRALQAAADGIESGGDGSGLSARALHWWIEALRRAFADRAMHLGDPDWYDVPTAALLEPTWIADRRISIGERAAPDIAAWVPPPPRESSETTHLSVIDEQGNAVSLTTTLNASFGSGILVEGAGFLLNNELDDFSIRPGVPNLYGLVGSAANQLAPRKRPLSSMTPTVVRDGGRRVSLVIGAPGGPRIISAVIEVLLRVLVYEQGLAEAVAAPRLHQQWKPALTRLESGFDPAWLETLEHRHEQPLEVEPGARFASVQAIWIGPDGVPVGVSDPRRGGVAGVQGRPLPRPRRPELPVR